MTVKRSPALSRLAAAGCDYKHVEINLIGEDGNANAILGRVLRALRRAGATKPEMDAFIEEATSGDYDHLLCTVMDWVTVGSSCGGCGKDWCDD